MSRVVVLGSGTDVGKTFVSCRLLEDLRARGVRVRVRKPVVSGFVDDADSDPRRLMAAAGSNDEGLDVVSPWRFPLPVSPDAAARAAGVVVDWQRLLDACAAANDDDARPAMMGDLGGTDVLVVVETAGGVLSPMTDDRTQLDVACALAATSRTAAVIVVDASYLGSISHGLSAVEVTLARGVDVVAVVVNRGPSEPFRRFLTDRVVIFDVDERDAIAGRIVSWFAASRS